MWIFTNNSFISVVRHRESPQYLMIRARRRFDLIDFFKGIEDVTPKFTAKSDYPYRVTVKESVYQKALIARSKEIDYDNFKESVKCVDRKRFYMQVWAEGTRFERGKKWKW